MKTRDIVLLAGGVALGGLTVAYFVGRKVASASDFANLASIGTTVEVETFNADKGITYKRTFDVNQWYCRILNSHINNNVRGGWRIQSLTLGLEEAELLAEADNFVDIIMFLDYFDKPDGSYYHELSFFVDGAQAWTKTITYLPRNEVLFRFPQDGYFRAICPFPI